MSCPWNRAPPQSVQIHASPHQPRREPWSPRECGPRAGPGAANWCAGETHDDPRGAQCELTRHRTDAGLGGLFLSHLAYPWGYVRK